MVQAVGGYRVIEEVQRDARSVLYRAEATGLVRAVLVRLAATVQARDADALRREHEILSSLESPLLDRVVDLFDTPTGPGLALEDAGQVPLGALIPDRGLALDRFLELAIPMAEALDQVHCGEIVHKAIATANFRVTPQGVDLRLGGFGRATRVPRETATARAPAMLDGDLRYIAPEQTGRMNRAVDYRSDLYSLGIVYYEMLTGRLPFAAADPMGWVHCHIAHAPPELGSLRPDLPAPLSAIIMRLLAKAAEQRYQSAEALRADLAAAQAEWRATGRIMDLVPGAGDRPRHLVLPQRLYGREAEIERLLDAFHRAAEGPAQCVMVAGGSGIGKSALVREVQKPLARERGYFIEGKYDQLKRDIPFSAVIAAFRDLLRQILTETPAELAAWAEGLRAALAPNAAVISAVLPELDLIIGQQSAVPDLPPVQMQNRFQLTMAQFIRQFATALHPLVVFLDDLQWADLASLDLLAALLGDPDCRHLLIVGAYRDNEVEPSHPLTKVIGQITKARPVTIVAPRPLGFDNVRDWLAEALSAPAETLAPLARLLLHKSGGNPFFLGQLVTALTESGVLARDAGSGLWQADVAAVEQAGLPDDVAGLLAGRLGNLPDATRDALRLAACIGGRFDLAMLSVIRACSTERAAEDLWPALRDGYVAALGDDGLYRFAHDRVQQAAYSLIDPDARAPVHLAIGRLMRAHAETADTNLFDLVRHLNLGMALIEDAGERTALCRLNHLAAKRARASAAFDIAHVLMNAAVACLPARDAAPGERRALLLDAVEAAILARDFTAFEQRRVAAEALAETDLHRAQVLELVVEAHDARNDFRRALDATLAGLRLLGMALDERHAKRDTLLLLLRLRLALMRHSVDAIAALPIMTDPRALQIMRLLASAVRASYQLASPLMPVLSLNGALLSIRHGVSEHSARCFNASGLIFISIARDIRRGAGLGDLCMRIGARFGGAMHIPNYLIVGLHWTQHYRLISPSAQAAFKELLLAGAVESAGICLQVEMTGRCASRADLAAEIEATQAALSFAARRDSWLIADTARNCLKTLDWLLLPTRPDEIMIQPYEGVAQSATGETSFMIRQAFILLVLGRPDLVREIAVAVRPKLRSVIGSAWVALFHWYEALALIDGLAGADPIARKAAERQIRQNLRLLRLWAKHAPMNQAHRVHSLEAELARLGGRITVAAAAYDAAIERANEHGFLGDAALIAESAAACHRAAGNPSRATQLLHAAYDGYRRWGAVGKLRRLEAAWPDLFAAPVSRSGDAAEPAALQALDVSTVTKVAQAITGELVLARLIERLLDHAMENAGARLAALALAGPNGLSVAAERRVGADVLAPAADRPLAETELPAAILLYVERTGSSVVLENAAEPTHFPPHRRWSATPATSVLCVPITHQGRFTGALYLENELIAGAFTPDRVELLQVMAAQAAIAIANARLFNELDRARAELQAYSQQLEQKVAARTRDLESRSAALEESLTRLRETQAQLVVQEKMASLGQVTAGIAHEIRNPLNFINNFSALSKDLLIELSEAVVSGDRAELDEILAQLDSNLGSIANHGKRADGIVRNMLMHSRGGAGEFGPTRINALLGNAIQLAVANAKAADADFDCRVDQDFAEDAGVIIAEQRELTRVMLNLLSNAFYAIAARRRAGPEPAWQPSVVVTTVNLGDHIEIRVRDNGTGIPPEHQGKLFTPFFTTKPTGQGTGLGLSVSWDIVVAQHQGSVTVESLPGSHSCFSIRLPRRNRAIA